MKEKKTQRKRQKRPIRDLASSIKDDLRQKCFDPAIRIEQSTDSNNLLPQTEKVSEPQTPAAPDMRDKSDRLITQLLETRRLVVELATCLWYIKTKHLKKTWDDGENIDDDPRVRRTLGRISKTMEVFKKNGFELKDPTNERYAQGNEGTIVPIELVPTAGVGVDKISETVTPLIWHCDHEQPLQKAKVFVAVPEIAVSPSLAPASSESAPKPLEGNPNPASSGAPTSSSLKVQDESKPEGVEIQASNNGEDSGRNNETPNGGGGPNPSANS